MTKAIPNTTGAKAINIVCNDKTGGEVCVSIGLIVGWELERDVDVHGFEHPLTPITLLADWEPNAILHVDGVVEYFDGPVYDDLTAAKAAALEAFEARMAERAA